MGFPYNPYKDSSVYLGLLQLPHVTNVTFSAEWNQTELPIERGALIVDHRRKLPRGITVSGYVTGQIELVPTSGAGVLLDSSAVRRQLELMADLGQTFIFKWLDRVVPNMSILSIEEDNDAAARRDDMWSFSLQLGETRVATSTIVPAGAVDPALADVTAAPLDGGPQAGTAVGPDMAGNVTGVLGGGV